MNPERPSKDVIDEARRKSITQTIRTINVEELKDLGERLFPSASDPWRDKYFRFIAENAGTKFYHAETSDRFEIVYSPAANKGIWILGDLGKGRLQAEGLELMKKIVEGL